MDTLPSFISNFALEMFNSVEIFSEMSRFQTTNKDYLFLMRILEFENRKRNPPQENCIILI